jgi:hypothetical protein
LRPLFFADDDPQVRMRARKPFLGAIGPERWLLRRFLRVRVYRALVRESVAGKNRFSDHSIIQMAADDGWKQFRKRQNGTGVPTKWISFVG